MVQNFIHFRVFSHPGEQANTSASVRAVPRSEAACVFSQQRTGSSTATSFAFSANFRTQPNRRPTRSLADEEADGPRHRLLKVVDAYYVANPERV